MAKAGYVTSTNGVTGYPDMYRVQQGYIDTVGVGGDRFGFLPKSMMQPTMFVGTSNPVPLALLSIPPTYGQLTSVAGNYSGPGAVANVAGANPWHPGKSLVPWVILGLLISVWGIHTLYFKKRKRG